MEPQSTERTPRNRLAAEISPYLRQHAHNPVDWHPWGEEALREAERRDVPILLSIGYSACHWCHVMEHESFDDPQIAELMNELFVNIKVDREERPDLDQIYQTVVQLMGRNGGWPLTVFLTPELKPFFAGTYFPPTDRYGMPGLPTVLRAVREAWDDRRDEVAKSADELIDAIGKVTSMQGDPEDPPREVIEEAARALADRFDEEHGGFGGAPKFPNTMCLDVQLRAWRLTGEQEPLDRVSRALEGMRKGGIHDQLGGGFHRYSVDERWLVPHFEKMLYDNALLARLYADGWRATGKPEWADTARSTVEYAMREMRSPEGGFYSSQDADSEGVEGKFFVWTPEELREVLGQEDAQVAALRWGVEQGGNFEHGTTVLHVACSVAEVADRLDREEQDVRQALERAREALFRAREQRVKPFRDEKVIASWNGLMIGAFAEVGAALGEPRYVEVAREGLDFVRRELWKDGRLLRIYKDGEARIEGFLEDYADVAGAALDVYEATMDEEALRFAQSLVATANERFWDDDAGAYWFGPADAPDVPVRTRESVDNAVPSGTSSMCHALLRLQALTDDETLGERAERSLRGLTRIAVENPLGFGHLLGAMDRYVHGPTEVVVVGEPGEREAEALLVEARRRYLPNRVLARVSPDAPSDAAGPAARLGGRRRAEGRAAAYVCRERSCSAPVTTPEALDELL